MSLGPPPADLTGFPLRPPRRAPRTLYRLYWHRNRAGALNSAWNFTSDPPGANRFDLPAPAGTCYWSDVAYGAFVEVFRGLRVIDPSDVDRRRLFVATPPGLRLADTTAPRACSFGVTVELPAITPYDLPQQWATRLASLGVDGLVALCRHDPSGNARTVAIFGRAGTPARRARRRVRRTRMDRDPTLTADLRRLGVRTVPIPFSVPTVRP
ncbi:MAG TPA: RES domain-containing protein [Actinomycetes bacterium]